MIFVNFHSSELIAPRVECLRSAGLECAVADNSGEYPDGPGVAHMGRNLGFGAACNRGAAIFPASVTALVLHNPDATIKPEDILAVAAHLGSQGRPGLAAPAEAVGDVVRLNGYHYPSPAREAGIALTHLLQGSVRRGVPSVPRVPRAARSGGRRFAGAALLAVDRAAFDDLGGFDERYFMYGEDLDLWHRMSAAGRDCEFVPGVVVEHAYGQGSPATAARREIWRWLGVELFSELHEGPRWRLVRSVHRVTIPLYAPHAPRLARLTNALWREGLRPSGVMRRLRPHLEAGTV